MIERADRVNINNPDFGRWIPSIDSIPIGTPEAATSPYRDMLQDHSYYVYTAPRPFDWYVYGFAINTTAVQVISVMIQVSCDEERENLSLRIIDAGAVLGWPVQTPTPNEETCQINSHWLPVPSAFCFDEGRGIWGWFNVDTGIGDWGAAGWAQSKGCRVERPPFKVTSGQQLRFIVANRFTAELPNTVISVVGARWLAWEGDNPARKVYKAA